jgi:hypothetical protein
MERTNFKDVMAMRDLASIAGVTRVLDAIWTITYFKTIAC